MELDGENLYKEVDIRKQKIKEIVASGKIAYVDKYDRTHTLAQASDLPDGTKVRVCGRIISKRMMGKLGFFHIADIDADIQMSIGRNEIDEEGFAWFKAYVDNADFVGVEGVIYHTHTGELTVKTHAYTLLSKAILPLPEKWHGMTDMDLKYRQRYLDIISNDNAKRVFKYRSKLLKFIRNYLGDNSFVEVETPILQSAVCGALAKPFITHHNALDKECNLRIAPEVYLKQVIACGMDRVFEIGKNFRNEGMDSTHLQEFTMLEWYASYWNFEDNILFFQKFIREVLMNMNGTTVLTFRGVEYDFGKEWDRVNYTEKLSEMLGFNILEFDRDAFVDKVVAKGILPKRDFDKIKSVGGCIDLVYKRILRYTLIQPTILYNYPACLIPLARPNDKDARIIDAFQVLVSGDEMCKAYSELVDPQLQRNKLEMQSSLKLDGDDEAMELDESFLVAMEHGMPPISGLGLGIDRLMMMLTDQDSIRDVVLFPIMK